MPILDNFTGEPIENFALRRPTLTPKDSTAGAAFRLENPGVALHELMTRPTFEDEPGFDLGGALKEVPELADNQRAAFAGTRSRKEFEYRKLKVRQELKDAQTLEAAGLPGLLWGAAAGLATPTTLVPIIGVAGRAVTAGRLARAAGATAGASVAVDETALRAANLTRTDLDTALAIGSAAILGAALGGLSGALTSTARNRAIREISETIMNTDRTLSPAEADEVVRGSGVGATAVGELRYVGGVEGLSRAGRAIAQMSPTALPSVRAAQRPSNAAKVLATTQQQFSTGGLKVSTKADVDSGLGMLEAVAPGGQLEGRSRAKERFFDKQIVDIVSGSFMKHEGRKFDGAFKYVRSEAAAIASGFRRIPGKMNFQEYNDELFRALNMGDESAVPEVAEAAAKIRKEIIQPVTEAAQRAGLLPEELKEDMLKGAKSYLMRVYDHQAMMRDPMKFVHMVVQHNQEQLQARWAEKLAKLREANTADAVTLQDRLREADEAAKLRKEISDEIEGMSAGPRAGAVKAYSDKLREANDVRKRGQELARQARGMRAETQQEIDDGSLLRREADKKLEEAKKLREEARRMKEDNSEIDEFLKQKKALEKRKTTLGRTLDKLIGDQAKAVDEADRIIRQSQDELVRFTGKAQKLLQKLDDTADERLDAVTNDLRKGVEKLDELMQKGDEQLAKLAEKYPELVDAPAEWQARVQRFKENVFDVEVYPRGPGGEKLLRIDGEASQKAALDAIDAVLDEGEIKQLVGIDVVFDKLSPAMRKSLEDWRGQIAALKWSDHLALRRAEESFDRKVAAQLSRQERADKLAVKLAALEGEDRDAMRQVLVGQLEDATELVRERVSKRAVREAALREKANKLGMKAIPEWFAENDRLAEAGRAREEALRAKAAEAGIEDFDLETGKISFSKELDKAAHDIKNKILGTFVRTPGIEIAGERGPALARMLDIPFDKEFTLNGETFTMKDFLMRDVSRVMRSYVRSLVPDTEIALRFNDNPALSKTLGDGQTTGSYIQAHNRDLELVENDLDWDGSPLAKPRSKAEKEKLSTELREEYEYGQQALRTLVARLRHTDGIPENPAGAWARSARTWRAFQVPLYMGNVLFASLPEVMVPVMRFGLKDTFRDGWAALAGDFKSWSAAAREAARSGQGLDSALSTRLMAFSDMQEINIRETRFEQLVDFFAQKTGTVAMFDAWTAFTKNMAAPIVMGRFMRSLETVIGGKQMLPKAQALETLAQAGINENLARRMWEQVQKHGADRTRSGYLMPRTEAWDDIEAIDALRGHLSTMLDITTVTPGLERPMWTTASEPARIISQFRSFGFSATSKMMLAGMQQRDIAVVQAYLGMMALGVASYGAWAAQYGPGTKQWDEFTDASWEKLADEAVARSGILAAFQDVQHLLSDFDVTHGLVNFSDTGAERLRGRDFRETLLGVSMSTASKIQSVLGGIDDPTQSTTKAMQQLMPYNNVWYLRRLLLEAKGEADQMFGVPEQR